jgi:hypothetical protein
MVVTQRVPPRGPREDQELFTHWDSKKWKANIQSDKPSESEERYELE